MEWIFFVFFYIWKIEVGEVAPTLVIFKSTYCDADDFEFLLLFPGLKTRFDFYNNKYD